MTSAPASQWARALADEFSEVGRELAAAGEGDSVLAAISRLAVERVPGAEAAGITRYERQVFVSVAPTNELAERVDQIQYELQSGPCVDAASRGSSAVVHDLRTDTRWPDFGVRAAAETGILSVLSFHLYLEDDPDVRAALNCYSTSPNAFDDTSGACALLLATHGALALTAALAEQKAANLEIALEHSRDIGVALGVLMSRHKITREQAFDLLRVASQRSQRKLYDIAVEVGEIGDLPEIPSRRGRHPATGSVRPLTRE